MRKLIQINKYSYRKTRVIYFKKGNRSRTQLWRDLSPSPPSLTGMPPIVSDRIRFYGLWLVHSTCSITTHCKFYVDLEIPRRAAALRQILRASSFYKLSTECSHDCTRPSDVALSTGCSSKLQQTCATSHRCLARNKQECPTLSLVESEVVRSIHTVTPHNIMFEHLVSERRDFSMHNQEKYTQVFDPSDYRGGGAAGIDIYRYILLSFHTSA